MLWHGNNSWIVKHDCAVHCFHVLNVPPALEKLILVLLQLIDVLNFAVSFLVILFLVVSILVVPILVVPLVFHVSVLHFDISGIWDGLRLFGMIRLRLLLLLYWLWRWRTCLRRRDYHCRNSLLKLVHIRSSHAGHIIIQALPAQVIRLPRGVSSVVLMMLGRRSWRQVLSFTSTCHLRCLTLPLQQGIGHIERCDELIRFSWSWLLFILPSSVLIKCFSNVGHAGIET